MEDRAEQFQKINREVRAAIKRLKPYQWLAAFPQLVSRVVHKHSAVWVVLLEMVVLVIDNHPHQAMWSMIAGSQSKDAERKKRFGEIVNRVKVCGSRAWPGDCLLICCLYRRRTLRPKASRRHASWNSLS